MSFVNGILRNSVSERNQALFNNISVGTNGSRTSLNNILGIDLAEYSSITRGSYNKLAKAYYTKFANKKTSGLASEDMSKEESDKTRTTIKKDAEDLFKAAGTLASKGSNSVFKKVDVKDSETGNVSKEYDTDKIYKAVSSMVDSYNSLVKSSSDSRDKAVLRQTLHMVHSASANRSLLNDIGIQISKDNKLSIDEETFKKADMSTVKSLFNGAGSFGAGIQSNAGDIYTNAGKLLSNRNTYTSSGTVKNYSTGSLLDSML